MFILFIAVLRLLLDNKFSIQSLQQRHNLEKIIDYFITFELHIYLAGPAFKFSQNPHSYLNLKGNQSIACFTFK